MNSRIVVMEISQLEAAHLNGLVEQFLELLGEPTSSTVLADPAVARLVPDAYRDDEDAADDFRRLTQDDLLQRRRADAETVRADLSVDGRVLTIDELGDVSAAAVLTVRLDDSRATAWLRTLTAIRLVLAGRLGVTHEHDYDPDDPRYGVYEWLGYRLEGLLQVLDD